MKTPTFAALLAATLPLAAEVKTSTSGEVTVTVNNNGKVETKTYKLGDGGSGFQIETVDAKTDAKVEKVTFLGIAPGPVPDEVRAHVAVKDGEGILATHVLPGSPAEKAGLREHDILTRFDDQILVEPAQLKTLVKMKKPGDTVKLAIFRKGEQKEITITLGETEERKGDAFHHGKHPGMEKWMDFWKDGKADAKKFQEHFKNMKEKLPGVVLESRGFILGPDGKMKQIDGGTIEEITKSALEKLKDAKIPEEALKNVEKALRDAADGVGSLKKDQPKPE